MDPPSRSRPLRRGDLDVVITEEGGFEGDADARAGSSVEQLLDDVHVRLAAQPTTRSPRGARSTLADLCDEDWMLAGLRGTCADSNIVLRACQRRRLRAARRLHLRRLLRDPGPGGQRDGRRAGARASALA